MEHLTQFLASSNKPPHVYDGEASTPHREGLHIQASHLPPPVPLVPRLPPRGRVVKQFRAWTLGPTALPPSPGSSSHCEYEHVLTSLAVAAPSQNGDKSSTFHIGRLWGLR